MNDKQNYIPKLSSTSISKKTTVQGLSATKEPLQKVVLNTLNSYSNKGESLCESIQPLDDALLRAKRKFKHQPVSNWSLNVFAVQEN